MGFQLKSKNLFLTFPQCEFPLKDFAQNITTFFSEYTIEKGICSREEHDDGNHHLHAAICLRRQYRTRDPRCFDQLVSPTKHGDYVGRFRGGTLKAFNYVKKDGNYLPLPLTDPPRFDLLDMIFQMMTKKQKVLSIIDMIEDGKTLDDLDDEDPAYVMRNLKVLQSYYQFRELKAKRRAFAEAQETKVRVRPVAGSFGDWNHQIASWVNSNIRTTRVHRQKQIWIQAPPGMGKTSFVMMLEREFKLSIYFWPKEEAWMDGYSDGAYDLIVLDEYIAQKRITELNSVLSGDPIPLSRRGTFPIVKRDLLPVMILSNFKPDGAYSKVGPSYLAPLLDRLIVVECRGMIRLEPVPETPPPTPPPLPAPAVPSAQVSVPEEYDDIEDDDHFYAEVDEDELLARIQTNLSQFEDDKVEDHWLELRSSDEEPTADDLAFIDDYDYDAEPAWTRRELDRHADWKYYGQERTRQNAYRNNPYRR